jgi:hypothetical protein
LISSNSSEQGLVDNAEHRDNIDPLRLGYELGNDPNIIKRTLGIGKSHDSIQKVDRAEFAGVVVSCIPILSMHNMSNAHPATYRSEIQGWYADQDSL